MRLDEARVGLHSSWPFDDRRSWSGMIRPAVTHLEAAIDSTRLTPTRVSDSLLDRGVARLSSRTVLPAHSIVTARRRSRALQVEARSTPLDAVIAIASSTDLVRPLGVPIIQITDATFPALLDFYPMYSGMGRLGRVQGRWVERRAARNTHHFVVTSDWARDSLVADVGVPEKQITIAPFGPAITPPHDAPPQPPADGPLRLVFISSDWERKNGAAALGIVRRLRTRRDVELIIVGDAPPEAADSATLLGRLDAKELSTVYSRGHVLLEPALANASGVVITDALHHGLPVLASAVGGVPTLLDSSSSWLLPPDELVTGAVEILDRVSGAELLARSRSASAAASQHLSWDSWVESIASIEIPAHQGERHDP